MKYALRIAYDGTLYSGWQVQRTGLAIQGIIEERLQRLLKQPVRLVGAGRTDTGVHALGQVAHFSSSEIADLTRCLTALRALLPKDISIQSFVSVSDSFHAQHSALSKQYHYHLWLERAINPCLRLYRYHLHDQRFSLSRLEEGLAYFLGTHDFTSFANVGSSATHAVRTLTRLSSIIQEGGIRLEFEGNGFLYKMVRNIMGTLIEVALGKRSPKEISSLLAAKQRTLTGPAAPAHGLFLVNIHYDPSPFIL